MYVCVYVVCVCVCMGGNLNNTIIIIIIINGTGRRNAGIFGSRERIQGRTGKGWESNWKQGNTHTLTRMYTHMVE